MDQILSEKTELTEAYAGQSTPSSETEIANFAAMGMLTFILSTSDLEASCKYSLRLIPHKELAHCIVSKW